MRNGLLVFVAAVSFACGKGNSVSFEGAKVTADTRPVALKSDEKKQDAPAGLKPFNVTETRSADYMAGQGLMLTVWHQSGAGNGQALRAAIAKDIALMKGATSIAHVDRDELTETPNVLKWRRHMSLPGGLGSNESHLFATAADGTLHRWTLTCIDLLQDARCPKTLDTFELEEPADFSAP